MFNYLIEELPFLGGAQSAFDILQEKPYSFFLDSGMVSQRLGRYSFIGSDPFLIIKSRGRNISIIKDGQTKHLEGDPFEYIRNILCEYALPSNTCPVPFVGGAVGYFSYDLCHFIERLPTHAVDDLGLPECYLVFYDTVMGFDNITGKCYLVSTGFPLQTEDERRARAEERKRYFSTLLRNGERLNNSGGDGVLLDITSRRLFANGLKRGKGRGIKGEGLIKNISTRVRSNFTHKDYLQAVRKAREYIVDGDIFQVNLSQRFEANINIEPYQLYRRLRAINPAPFAAYLNFDEVKVLSSSPERFLKVDGDYVETRPIKGTRPRGKTPEIDREMSEELLNSFKDKAENVMIVDLERNDIGRVCAYGSVKVTELWAPETYPTVFHLTSTVTGRLRTGKDRIDLLKATFPGGSITGAPKVRSMEIIDELEPTRRSVYTGAIGYLGFDGRMDLNIVIRTILIKGDIACFQVGGGIVYDSEPEAEYQETLDKARALFRALGISYEMDIKR